MNIIKVDLLNNDNSIFATSEINITSQNISLLFAELDIVYNNYLENLKKLNEIEKNDKMNLINEIKIEFQLFVDLLTEIFNIDFSKFLNDKKNGLDGIDNFINNVKNEILKIQQEKNKYIV